MYRVDKTNRALRYTLSTLFVGALLTLGGCASQSATELANKVEPRRSPIGELRHSFRENYDHAIDQHYKKMRSEYPIVVQDLLNMTLLKADGESVRFGMQKNRYFLVAHTSHPPLTVYSILSLSKSGPLTDEQRFRLSDLRNRIDRAERYVHGLREDRSVITRIQNILSKTSAFIERTLEAGTHSPSEYAEYAAEVLPDVQSNLEVGAAEQIAQFRQQMSGWKSAYPDENWDETRVVILGFHQARRDYVLTQLFQWLLREPEYENRVVFAEFQYPIFGENKARAEELALLLATKVDFDLDVSDLFFGDPSVLQHDVMGPAAKEIIQSLGRSDW